MFKKLLTFMAALSAALYAAMAFAAVDVNSATSAELDSIKGIGPVKSTLILAERKKAPFKDWEDFVTRVKGVGTDSAAQFSAAGMTVNGASYRSTAKAAAKAASPADKKTDKNGADKAREAAATPKTGTAAEVRADVKAGTKADASKK
jgi:competence protein ComEA